MGEEGWPTRARGMPLKRIKGIDRPGRKEGESKVTLKRDRVGPVKGSKVMGIRKKLEKSRQGTNLIGAIG